MTTSKRVTWQTRLTIHGHTNGYNLTRKRIQFQLNVQNVIYTALKLLPYNCLRWTFLPSAILNYSQTEIKNFSSVTRKRKLIHILYCIWTCDKTQHILANIFNAASKKLVNKLIETSELPTKQVTEIVRNCEFFKWARTPSSPQISNCAVLFCKRVIPNSLTTIFKKCLGSHKLYYQKYYRNSSSSSMTIFTIKYGKCDPSASNYGKKQMIYQKNLLKLSQNIP